MNWNYSELGVALLLVRLTNGVPLSSRSSYLLVVLHIVAQTDQTGFELLCHQGPAVVLRSAKHPMTEHHIMRMNPNP